MLIELLNDWWLSLSLDEWVGCSRRSDSTPNVIDNRNRILLRHEYLQRKALDEVEAGDAKMSLTLCQDTKVIIDNGSS